MKFSLAFYMNLIQYLVEISYATKSEKNSQATQKTYVVLHLRYCTSTKENNALVCTLYTYQLIVNFLTTGCWKTSHNNLSINLVLKGNHGKQLKEVNIINNIILVSTLAISNISRRNNLCIQAYVMTLSQIFFFPDY